MILSLGLFFCTVLYRIYFHNLRHHFVFPYLLRMILPINTYNDAVLREKAVKIDAIDAELTQLIDDMYETMYQAHGVGLAAPQIGKSIRLFVIDADAMFEDDDPDVDKLRIGPTTFINPEIVSMSDVKIPMDEGCLSLPDLRESIVRPESLVIRYKDRDFNDCELEATGWLSRVIQHEYDHLDGVLFFERLGSFRRRLLKSKLDAIASGLVLPEYPVVPKAL
jgi:peptide deformylase